MKTSVKWRKEFLFKIVFLCLLLSDMCKGPPECMHMDHVDVEKFNFYQTTIQMYSLSYEYNSFTI